MSRLSIENLEAMELVVAPRGSRVHVARRTRHLAPNVQLSLCGRYMEGTRDAAESAKPLCANCQARLELDRARVARIVCVELEEQLAELRRLMERGERALDRTAAFLAEPEVPTA